MMKEALDRLEQTLREAPARLADISDEVAARAPQGGWWSPKQVLGHLIDSAANNQQRWVRVMGAPRLEIAPYQQMEWVESQAYATERWPDLVNLWLLFNRHLLHFLRTVPDEKLLREVVVGDKPPMTVAALTADYMRHMQHHLAQIFDRAAATQG